MAPWVAALGFIATALAQDADSERRALHNLQKRAELFARQAPKYAGRETLKQTVNERTRRGQSVVRTREIVSDYGFVEASGSLVELRQVVSVDGKPVRSKEGGLDALAKVLLASGDRDRRKLLEAFERHGLRGAARDVAQLILLFAPPAMEQYEFKFAGPVKIGDTAAYAYAFQQLDGPAAMTVFREGAPVKRRIQGHVWFRAQDMEPQRIGIVSDYSDNGKSIRILSLVDYDSAGLPSRVVHAESVNGELYVKNEYSYSGFAPRL